MTFRATKTVQNDPRKAHGKEAAAITVRRVEKDGFLDRNA